MSQVTHAELRDTEVRMSAQITMVASDLGDVKADGIRVQEQLKTVTKTQDGHGVRLDGHQSEIAEVHAAYKGATTEISLLGKEMKAARVAKDAEDAAKILKAKEAEEARVAWWKDWRGAVTPQNAIALLVILSAFGAWVQGQMTNAELLEEVRRGQEIVSPAPESPVDPPAPSP